jgi:two-component system, LytTR family, sensor kinase
MQVSRSNNFVATAIILSVIACFHLQLLIHHQVPLIVACKEAGIYAFCLAIVYWLQVNWLSFYLPKKNAYWVIPIWSLILAAITTIIIWYCLPVMQLNTPQYTVFFNNLIALRIFILWLLIMAAGLYQLMLQTRLLDAEIAKREQAILQVSNEAQLYKLRNQIQPHFLFNSLNSINALIGGNPVQARQMVVQLSDYLRASVTKHDTELITFKDELHYVELYLQIEQIRFGSRLQVKYNISTEAYSATLPALILQPLIENAIKYGLYNTIDDVVITITAQVVASKLQVSITNPTSTHAANKPPQGTGFGLQAINKRLQLIYNVHELLQIKNEPTIFTAVLYLPQ